MTGFRKRLRQDYRVRLDEELKPTSFAGSRQRRRNGVGYGDLFVEKQRMASWCESIEDGRRNRTFCECGAEVDLVKTDSGWQKRDIESGLPHLLSCPAA